MLDTAVDVVLNLRAYDRYGESNTAAIRALKRRAPGFSDRQYANAFAKAWVLYDVCTKHISFNQQVVFAAFEAGGKDWTRPFIPAIRQACPGFLVSTYSTTFGFLAYLQCR